MSYENLLAGLYTNNLIEKKVDNNEPENTTSVNEPANFSRVELFTVDKFKEKLKQKSSDKNKDYQNASQNISSYDLFSCIRIPYFRIKSFVVEDYSNNWLPIEMRATLGTAAHEFIQSVPEIFTETEVCLKVPDLKLSIRLDGLINDNVLVEIKSCAYSDYDKILKSNKPRTKDFYQTMIYKYILENYLDVVKQQKPSRNGVLPSLESYNITHIQFVYVCHELISADADSFEESLLISKNLKKQLDSKRNPFWFIKSLTVDLTKINVIPYFDFINEKLSEINKFLESDIIPPMDHKYINKSDCYFCLYNKICNNY